MLCATIARRRMYDSVVDEFACLLCLTQALHPQVWRPCRSYVHKAHCRHGGRWLRGAWRRCRLDGKSRRDPQGRGAQGQQLLLHHQPLRNKSRGIFDVGVAFFLRVDVRDGHTWTGIAKKDLWITRRLASVCAIVCVLTIEIVQLDVSVKFTAAILRAQHRLAYIFLFHLIKHETSYTYPQYFTAVREAGAGPAEVVV